MDLRTLPTSLKAVIYDRLGKTSVKLVEAETPIPGHGQILVNFYVQTKHSYTKTHSGACHSDHSFMTHALGTGLKGSTKRIGDRVSIKYVYSACRTCIPCPVSAESCCTSMQVSGYALRKARVGHGDWIVVSGIASRAFGLWVTGVDVREKEDSDSAYACGLEMLRFNAVLVVVGSIVGSSVGNYRESLEVKGLAQRGVIRFCVEVERLRDLQGVFEI
ncbi:hypothetical protein BDV29DRAFT_187778 [Aspergillus leporis]|uniref:Uncharacterized protein n=1 Tax=Aspergillus leporis TaxID=41062 RepID=A0A5N5XEW6_9EURO|nr:hypothetical protein BDV29DRAFT_187778 [Aspergillus leporis]